MLRLNQIIGTITDPHLAKAVHTLEHRHCVEYITLDSEDIKRKRLRVSTDRGTDCGIILERDEHLENGSILLMESERAIAIRLLKTQWLTLRPNSIHAALKLGHFTGNLHWHVDAVDAVLKIAMAGSRQSYLEHLQPLLDSGSVEQVDDD